MITAEMTIWKNFMTMSTTAMGIWAYCPWPNTGPRDHADKGAAAVPHHHGDGQGHHRQGEHHRVGGVAAGPQIVGVGNEDLVHDVVQCPHQQGDHAGNGVASHEPPHTLRSQKIVGAFHKISLSFLQNPRRRAFLPQKKRGASATGFTQKRHTLWNQYIRFWENLQMVVVCKNRLPSGGPEWTIFTMTPGRRSYFAYSSPMSQFSVRPGRIRVRNTKN